MTCGLPMMHVVAWRISEDNSQEITETNVQKETQSSFL
jgi:hypothetical protein